MDSIAFAIMTSAIGSFLLAVLLVLTAGSHGRFTMDSPGAIQKFHLRPTPRIGGIGIYLALLAASSLISDADASRILITILLAGIPALLVGLLEDLTKKIGVAARLAATMASGWLAWSISGTALMRLDFLPLDLLLAYTPAAVLFTAFAVGGVTNAINIIDGFHGLASGTATLCLLALAGIAGMAGDYALVLTALVVAAAVVGFWVVNFPWGKLFLGDGGAYFSGFALAWIAVLLPARNPEVSPWASLLVCAYPIIEVIYSMVRRRQRRQSPANADRGHLHSLVATGIILPRLALLHPTLQNSAVSVVMWVGAAVPALAALACWRRTELLMFCAAACVLLYHLIYRRVAAR